MRIDVVPWEYCAELSKMLDRMPPFPVEQALAAVERAAGRPWTEVFTVFDPQPVGSASLACVFQAVLRDGSKVAVKVRRPGIGDVFAADFRVLDWLFGSLEALAILRPGFTGDLRREFRETLLEELDFRKEAQFQYIFRRNAPREEGRDFFTAPKVYPELSSEEVIVQEFVSGMFLWEVIAAIEHRDPEGLAMMQRMRIDPATVARRVMWSSFWSMEENLFFHADPHPANIVVGENSTLTYIDFGSCGSFNNEQRWAMQRIARAMQAGDAERMARATLKMMEPFPPIDVVGVMKEVQEEYTRVLYTFRTKAKHTQWWERTSARQWLSLVQVAHKFHLPFNLHTLRVIRATLLYDSVVIRLDHRLDRWHEYATFMREQGQWARARWRARQRTARRQFALRANELAATARDVLERAQQTLSSPVAEFTSLIDKSVFAFSVFTRLAGRLLLLAAAGMAVAGWRAYSRSGGVEPAAVFLTVVRSKPYVAIAIALIALNVRHILLRFRERDEKHGRR
jgi:predicted unusual protein kinase regulating ubiquinone biosynthesis (AarF/ABC1/UbiB family)